MCVCLCEGVLWGKGETDRATESWFTVLRQTDILGYRGKS